MRSTLIGLVFVQGCALTGAPGTAPEDRQNEGASGPGGAGGPSEPPIISPLPPVVVPVGCGDGTLQASLGEECDGTDVPVEGMSCNGDCKLVFPTFRINEVYADGSKYFVEIGGPPNQLLVDEQGEPLRIIVANQFGLPFQLGDDQGNVNKQTGANGYYVLYLDLDLDDVHPESNSDKDAALKEIDMSGSVWLLPPGGPCTTTDELDAEKQSALDGVCWAVTGGDCSTETLGFAGSLARVPNGRDTDVCSHDLVVTSPTPGAPNLDTM